MTKGNGRGGGHDRREGMGEMEEEDIDKHNQ